MAEKTGVFWHKIYIYNNTLLLLLFSQFLTCNPNCEQTASLSFDGIKPIHWNEWNQLDNQSELNRASSVWVMDWIIRQLHLYYSFTHSLNLLCMTPNEPRITLIFWNGKNCLFVKFSKIKSAFYWLVINLTTKQSKYAEKKNKKNNTGYHLHVRVGTAKRKSDNTLV